MLLGCIADDFTGATDLANTLAREGMRTVLTIGTPSNRAPDADAVVVALKSRTIPAEQATAQSLAACRWLKRDGARQILFKYCSTFDSTDKGNIGPVADALLDELNAEFSIACPAFPENGRTIYLGHLFVGDALLSDSGMRDHPITPMRDANLVRVLSRQTRGKVGLVRLAKVREGASAISQSFASLRALGYRYAIVDALVDEDLRQIGAACESLALVTGGSGVALGLPGNFRRAGLLPERVDLTPLAPVGGHAAVLSGSCSEATLRQVKAMKARHPSRFVSPLEVSLNPSSVVEEVVKWALPLLGSGPVLIYSSASPEKVSVAHNRLGRVRAAAVIEEAMAQIAVSLVRSGVRRLVVAGGETSGAVVRALGLQALAVGPQIDPGVPAVASIGDPRIAMALKSGNFGLDDFFLRAVERLK